MGFTNETLHYGIPLPVGSDLTTPMDYNQAAEAVDAAIYQATTDAAGAASTAGTAQTAAAEAQTAAANAVADAATAHGLADTAVQAASAAQTAAESAQTTATAAAGTANAVSAVVGSGALDTEAQTVIPAINELDDKLTITDISSQLVPDTPVDTVNAKSMRRMGKLIDVDFSVTLNQELSNGSAIFGGLPKPLTNGSEQFTFTAINSGVHTPILFHYVNGYLGAIYPQSGITGNGSVITGHVMYIAE